MSLKIAVIGASGRMGRAVVRLATEQGLQVGCAVGEGSEGRDAGELAGVGAIGTCVTSDLGTLGASGAEVAIDFSSAGLVSELAPLCASSGIALVSGTTGLDAEAQLAIQGASSDVAVLWEPNMSVGVHVLGLLLEKAIAALGIGFDVEIVETHHRDKLDAPSGTGRKLFEIARRARGEKDSVISGREGKTGRRPEREIGVLAVRGGDVVGDHQVHLLGVGERIELTHRATSRDLFAQGSVRAAIWIAGRTAGAYSLADVLGSPS